MRSTATNAAAVAEAAAKAAADEKAAEEAAKAEGERSPIWVQRWSCWVALAEAFAAEMKMSRSIARALVPEQGPEAVH